MRNWNVIGNLEYEYCDFVHDDGKPYGDEDDDSVDSSLGYGVVELDSHVAPQLGRDNGGAELDRSEGRH